MENSESQLRLKARFARNWAIAQAGTSGFNVFIAVTSDSEQFELFNGVIAVATGAFAVSHAFNSVNLSREANAAAMQQETAGPAQG